MQEKIPIVMGLWKEEKALLFRQPRGGRPSAVAMRRLKYAADKVVLSPVTICPPTDTVPIAAPSLYPTLNPNPTKTSNHKIIGLRARNHSSPL